MTKQKHIVPIISTKVGDTNGDIRTIFNWFLIEEELVVDLNIQSYKRILASYSNLEDNISEIEDEVKLSLNILYRNYYDDVTINVYTTEEGSIYTVHISVTVVTDDTYELESNVTLDERYFSNVDIISDYLRGVKS